MEPRTSLADRVRADHDLVEELLVEAEAQHPAGAPQWGDEAPAVLSPTTLIRLVLAHIDAADVVVGVATERLPDGPLLAREAMHEHVSIREHLAVLQRVPQDSEEHAGAFDGLANELRQHRRPEEELVDRLTGALGETELAALHHEFELVRAGTLLGDAVVPLDEVSERAVESAHGRIGEHR